MLLSEAFYVPLQCFEVRFRNKVDAQMSQAYGASWLLDSGVALLKPHSRGLIDKTIEGLGPKEVGHGMLVAELNFGFWVGLCAKQYDAVLWRGVLYKAFLSRGGKRRSDVYGRVNAIRRLRNRIAHHEPIFHRPLGQLHDEILGATEWMCPNTAKWAESNSRVPQILNGD